MLEISILKTKEDERFFETVKWIAEMVKGRAAWWGASREHAVIHIFEEDLSNGK